MAGRERFVALDALPIITFVAERLESTGKLALFAAEKDAWDTARFAPPESEESRWDVRWDRFRAEMEGWK